MSQMPTVLLCLFLAALLGCAVGPEYRRPDIAVPQQWAHAGQPGLSAAAIEARQWWRTLNAPMLDVLIERAVQANLDLQSSDIGSLFSAGSRGWAFGPRFIWPIFDAGRIRANIEVQTARQAAALARYERAVLVALEDVENALIAFAQERLRHRSLAAAVAASRRAVDLSLELYTRGLGDFLRVLESQRSLFASEDQLVESERAVVANLIAVYKGLGGGWEVWTPAEGAEPLAARVTVSISLMRRVPIAYA